MTEYVTGVKELERKLKNIDLKMRQKVLAQSLRRAMAPIRKEAVANAPTGTRTHKTYKGRVVAPGFLKKNIKLKKMKIRDKRFAGYTLAARGEAWYGQIVEIGRKGKQGNPWLGKAWKSQKDQVQSRLIKELKKKIEQAKK